LLPEPERSSFKRPRWLIAAIVLLLMLLLWPGWAGFYSEWLWFKQLGYENVFSTTLRTNIEKIILFIGH
jgi:uncharacterized membrane protein (UPF0182 family)